jgi:hypothetical protein
MYLLGHVAKEKRNSTRAFEYEFEKHNKAIYDMIGIRDNNGNIVPLLINDKDMLYFQFYDTLTGRPKTHNGDLYTVDVARVGYNIVGYKAFRMMFKGDYVEHILRSSLHSKSNSAMSRFVDVLDNVEYGHDLKCRINYRVYDYYKDSDTVIGVDDFFQEVWMGLNIREEKRSIVDDLVLQKNGKWIEYKNIVQKLTLLGESINKPPISVIKKYEMYGVKFKMITTIECSDTFDNDGTTIPERKYMFYNTIVVEDIPVIAKNAITIE